MSRRIQYPCEHPMCWDFPHTHSWRWSFDDALAEAVAKWTQEDPATRRSGSGSADQ